MNLESKIEAILFYKNEPIKISKLIEYFDSNEEDIKNALSRLENNLNGRGVCLIRTNDEVALATAPKAKDFLDKITVSEMSKDIGKAGLETLSIVLYKGPVSRREIDYIRGVNSTFILRNLNARGLVDRIQDRNDQRTYKYKPSINLLAHLGIKKIEELPEFDIFSKKVENIMKEAKEEENEQI